MFKFKHSLAGSGLAGLLVTVVLTFGCGHSPTAPSSVELTLNQVAPSTGPIAGGSLVRLYGTGFKAGTAVAVRGTTVETNVLSATQLSVIMPAGAAGPADLVVTNPDGKTAKLAGGYTYLAPVKTATKVRVTGPTTVAPGATARFVVEADYPDGTSENVSALASWSAFPSGVLTFSSGGESVAIAAGDVFVRAAFQRVSASLQVLVIQPGVYRASGTVTSAGNPLSGATVDVTSGTGIGLRAVTNYAGQYALYGVAGDVTIRVSADEFDPVVRTVVARENLVTDFDLHAIVTPTDISGTWTMTLAAAAACRLSLPEAFRERRFDVVISQQATRTRLRLISSTLDESDGEWAFDGRLTDRVLRLDLPRGRPFFDWLLLENLGGNRFLGISGAITATLGTADLDGTLDGDMVLYQVQSGPTLEVAACRDSGHSLTLRRR